MEKFNLNDLHKLNIAFQNNEIDSKEYSLKIKSFIESTIIGNDSILNFLININTENPRKLHVRVYEDTVIGLNSKHVRNYLNISKKSIENLLKVDSFFNNPILVEPISILKYYIYKSNKFKALLLPENAYEIYSKGFNIQNETFKYLFSIFDKLTYLALHIASKYNDSQQRDPIRFMQDFANLTKFISKSDSNSEELENDINRLSKNNYWHYIRKLRNALEHDFSDPNEKYNIKLDIDILFILIGYITISIQNNLLSKEAMYKKLTNK